MAYKMKGFPLRSAFTKKSGFKHADQSGAHSEEDHTHIEASEEEEVKKPESRYADFDIEKEKGNVQGQLDAMKGWMADFKRTGKDPYNKYDNVQNQINEMNQRLEQLASGDLTGYERLLP